MNRRELLALIGGAAAARVGLPAFARAATAAEPAAAPVAPPGGQTLYNGIRLPTPWPPKLAEPLDTTVPPPYVTDPPAVIAIDVGRQLFVDDFLIERTDLVRTLHRPTPHPGNPIVRADKPWEGAGSKRAMAMVFSDGVWFDPDERLFKMWYMGGYGRGVCYARSEDGMRWEKPGLNAVEKGTNLVHPGPRDSAIVWLDGDATDPRRRYVMFRSHSEGGRFGQSVHFAADGVHWGERAIRTGSTGDRTTAFYNPFRKVWVYSLRHGWGQPRKRRYWETPDLVSGPQWEKIDEPTIWLAADRLDPQRDDLRTPPELYNLDCVAYESLILGLFTIWRGDKNIPPGRPKPNNVCVGFSRDGFHWHRPGDRSPFIDVSEKAGDWNWGNVQSAGGCCLVVGDELWFYHSGRAGTPQTGDRDGKDAGGSTGLATMRRDGFASMDAGEAGGSLTTRPVRFSGRHLFVNAAVREGGELTAEVLDDRGEPLPGLASTDCVPVRADKTKQTLAWKTAPDLSAARGKPVRLRFHLKDASLYSFWVSPDELGASGGYLAAGGPGVRVRDT